jgi:hypothetical protein
MTKLDELSLTTVPIELFFREQLVSHATAFVWRLRSRCYLITNWHVVSGRHNTTGSNLHRCGAWPDRIKAKFSVESADFWKETVELPLWDDEGRPLWLVHPLRPPGRTEREGVDVIALPLPVDFGQAPKLYIRPVNELVCGTMEIAIGMEVFILGYPFGVALPALPVWKRGSIASEPDLVRSLLGYYFVDTASRPGMSGAPVFLRSIARGRWRKFIGVYSGRLSAQNTDAEIGMVWHEAFIDEIIAVERLDRP